jgi:thiol-disulfide isomerase/thioredoxin
MKGIKRMALLLVGCAGLSGAAPSTPPEFTHKNASDWINSEPLTLAGLKGKVVLVEMWAFECVNCVNSRPWVESIVQNKTGAGLVVIGVHSPEFSEEHSVPALHKAVEKFGIHYPVMIDNDSSYWHAMHTQVWPTFYIIGRDGLLYAGVPGELHVGDERATKVEAAIDLLLKAPAS